MPLLRLAYVALFLIALIAVFVAWDEVGGQSHLDALPWSVKLSLGAGAAFAAAKATSEAVAHDRAWNAATVKWCAILLFLLIGCGMASRYSHIYLEDDEPTDEESATPAISQTL